MSDRLSPNWLAETLAEATSDITSAHGPGWVKATPLRDSLKPPLPEDEARRTRAKMADRYHAWTGRDLGADLASDEGSRP